MLSISQYSVCYLLKAAKGTRSDAQREKDRKRKEHAQRILGKQAGKGAPPLPKRPKGDKPPPPPPPSTGPTPSNFQNLFTQRAQGFQVEFRFRNAPPRPPVGPCFVGHSLDGVLVERSRQYMALNAVEVNYKWKLHSEPDLGVPLAPSAMDVKSYQPPKPAQEVDNENNSGLGVDGAGIKGHHPADEALLNWQGSLGDTAGEQLKNRQDQMRAAARMALAEGKGPIPNVLTPANMEKITSPSAAAAASVTSKKAFSRVLDESMQTWMKKTTYLSNDYTRKVHDFKSLASTKAEMEQDLEQRQRELNMRRSAPAITNTFKAVEIPPIHPTKKHLKPKIVMPLLPNVDFWGYSYTHVVIDKAPINLDLSKNNLSKAFVANVEQRNKRMSCKMLVPPQPKGSDSDSEKSGDVQEDDEEDPYVVKYRPIQHFDLDVIPLKEEDSPYVHFSLWVDPEKRATTYLPLSSRVQLSTGRPVKRRTLRMLTRRPPAEADLEEMKERIAEVDCDVAKEIGNSTAMASRRDSTTQAFMASSDSGKAHENTSDSDADQAAA